MVNRAGRVPPPVDRSTGSGHSGGRFAQWARFRVETVAQDGRQDMGKDGKGMPLSALSAAARRAYAAAVRSPDFGVQVKSIRADFERVREHVQAVLRARA